MLIIIFDSPCVPIIITSVFELVSVETFYNVKRVYIHTIYVLVFTFDSEFDYIRKLVLLNAS